jgi:hypothetical protein
MLFDVRTKLGDPFIRRRGAASVTTILVRPPYISAAWWCIGGRLVVEYYVEYYNYCT